MKNAILILSDPRSGSDESNGRLFNALAAAYDLQQRKHAVSILFQGAGTRWPALLAQPEHPFHDLFTSVRGSVGGVSLACSAVFGARDGAEASGINLLSDNQVPGTGGLPSLGALLEDGYHLLIF
jgi:hypothetical protein